MTESASTQPSFPDPPTIPGDSHAWGRWAVEFLDRFCRMWNDWQKTWSHPEVPVYRPGDDKAFCVLDRATRRVGTSRKPVTDNPPPGLDQAAPRLVELSAAVQRFCDQSVWRFESTKQANEVAEKLLAVAQNIDNARYQEVAQEDLGKLSRLVRMATHRNGAAAARRSEVAVEPPKPAVPERAPEATTETPTEVSIPDRARKASQQYQQVAKALGVSDPTDRQAYDQLAIAFETSGEKTDLPRFDTWQRNLREYRRLTGQQKNRPRAGREGSTGSLVRADQIEPERLPTRIRPERMNQ